MKINFLIGLLVIIVLISGCAEKVEEDERRGIRSHYGCRRRYIRDIRYA